jgi:hypothetical protein
MSERKPHNEARNEAGNDRINDDLPAFLRRPVTTK